MAYTIPETIRSSATVGERLLFQTLKSYLPDDYLVYYEPEINGKRPDFVIIGADLGIIVLEVKDYTKGTLYSLTKDDWTLQTSSGDVQTVKSPLLQARNYAFHIADLLKKDKNLIQLDGKHQGKLKFPYGYGTVFTRLKQEDFIKNDLYHVIEPQFVFTRDEIDPDEEGFSEEHLIEKLQNMLPLFYRNSSMLTEDDIQAIRYHMFPEVRISAEFKEPVYYQDQLLLSLHNIKTMDLYQENLAKQLGDKHRLIRGVAGSGKTLILASRTKLLARMNPDWKILVLCYAIPLAGRIRSMIQQMMNEPDDLAEPIDHHKGHGKQASVEVYNFHAWLWNTLKIRDDRIPHVLQLLEQRQMILPKYDAILIDEGQDFEPEWLKLIGQVLNQNTQSLLIMEDRAQNIFKRKTSLNQNIGLDFRGRSKVLTINYRNTAQVVQFAWDFFQKHSQLQSKVKLGSIEGVDILPPKSTKRKGPEPVIKRCSNLNEEMSFVTAKIRELHFDDKIPLSEMAILYRVKDSARDKMSYIETIRDHLKKSQIPHFWITENPTSKRAYKHDEETVKISTLDSVKGLDFRVVFIINIENLPFYREENQEREAALFYIGMTRALQWLVLTYSGDSVFTRYLDEVTHMTTHVQHQKLQ